MAWKTIENKFSTYQRFLFWCAGAGQDYLAKCPSTEAIKYESIGAIVAITGIAACFSMYLAVSIMWPMEQITPLIVAPLWGIFIFVLDRFIVSSMRPADSFLARFTQTLPRLLL